MPDHDHPVGTAAEVTEADFTGEADERSGHANDHGHDYSFKAALAHHALGQPAWEVAHQPLIIFDPQAYADYKNAHGGDYTAETVQETAWIGTLPTPFLNHTTFWGTITLILVSLVVSVWGRRRPEQLQPANRLQHAIEAITLYIRDEVVRPNIHHGDAWTAHFTAIFFAILAFNLLGLVPGTGGASANIMVTGAFAVTTLVTMLWFGMKEQGVAAYWSNLVPVPFSLKPLDLAIWLILAVIEVAGLLIKPTALAIRLFANMFAGHTVILSFTSLFFIVAAAGANEWLALFMGGFGLLIGIAIFLLKLLVAFIQAYVFTLLSAVFIGGSIHPEH